MSTLATNESVNLVPEKKKKKKNENEKKKREIERIKLQKMN